MTWAGARGDTEKKMAEALHFTLAQDKLHPAFNAIDLTLASRGQGAKGSDGGAFRLNIANALWGQIGYEFQPAFLDTLGQNYGAGMHIVDFIKDPEGSRGIINGWVSARTEDRIKELLPKGSVTSDAKLVLTNAIYFNAAWLNPFHAQDTKPLDFVRRDGTKIQVPTMVGGQTAPYGQGNGWSAVAIPYDAGMEEIVQLEMVLVMPDAGTLDAFEASLNGAKIASITESLSEYDVSMTMPKFKIESQFSLADALTKLGMGVAFSEGADFSGISTQSNLSISDVVHKAWVDVNETGTEAAAATGVVVGDTSAPPSAEIHLDHPFLFFIRDIPTKSVLFIGRVEDPS
jgi:serpin B